MYQPVRRLLSVIGQQRSRGARRVQSQLSNAGADVRDFVPASRTGGDTTLVRPRPVGRPAVARLRPGAGHATPYLELSLVAVGDAYENLRRALPAAWTFYAVKANPHPAVLSLLRDAGCGFDVASPAEIALCLRLGADPARLSYSNPVRKSADIAYAYERGVRLFVVDSGSELDKVVRHAPGASVLCRILLPEDPADAPGADWPLSRKFGCRPEDAVDLLLEAKHRGLDAAGLSFHVGSQQRDPRRFGDAIGICAEIGRRLAALGVPLRLLDAGGGFPAAYVQPAPSLESYVDTISAAMTRHYGADQPQLVLEPGRSLVADAGTFVTSVVGVTRRAGVDAARWVYLDAGIFGGLAECLGEAIQYRISTSRDGGATGPVVLAGPTCDSVDVLYERTRYALPLDLAEGDLVRFHSAGAYTVPYASIGFNGFAPPHVVCGA
jgi:ornithine decarboxylase